jgi:anti-sigma B factor antagonist
VPRGPVPHHLIGRIVTHPAAYDAGLILTSRTEHRGYVIAALSGELGLAAAPALREQLLNLVRPAASQLIIDLSGVRSADTSGLAVLIGSGRRATLLGGFLRLAAPSMAVAGVLAATGMDQHLDVFPTVKAAIAGRRVLTGLAEVATVAGPPAGHLLGRIRPPAATS